VGDVMAHDVTALPAGMSLEEAARDHFLRTDYGAYPVVRGRYGGGLVALRDVMDKPADERAHTSVQAVMMPLTARSPLRRTSRSPMRSRA
jgi:hypothetical protein